MATILPCGCYLVLPRDMFTANVIYRSPAASAGRTTPENFTSLLDDVTDRVFGYLPDDTWFYPGHGDDSTLGAQRPHHLESRERGW